MLATCSCSQSPGQYLSYGLSDSTNKKQSTGAVLLDFSKASDKIWNEVLLYKNPLSPSSVLLTRSYICDRTFRVSVGVVCSRARPVAAGVLQGSDLDPVLYLGYTNDQQVYSGVTLFLFSVLHFSSLSPGFPSVMF